MLYKLSFEKYETLTAFPEMHNSVIFDLNSMFTQSYTIIKGFLVTRFCYTCIYPRLDFYVQNKKISKLR